MVRRKSGKFKGFGAPPAKKYQESREWILKDYYDPQLDKHLNSIDAIKTLTSQKLEIKLKKDIEEEYKKLLPSRAENALDCIYLEVNQGVMRAKVRIDIYEAWMNPDLTVETRNEMVSLIWRIDRVENNEEKRKWLKKHENHLRNYATENWVRLRYQALEIDKV